MRTKITTLALLAALLAVALLTINLASATNYRLLCLGKGQTAEFSKCNPAIKDRTCDTSFCPYCVSLTNTSAYCPALINVCNGLGLSCTLLNDSSVDQKAPDITLIDPIEGKIYNKSRSISLALDFSEQVDVKILDLVSGSGRWSQLCNNCFDYNRTKSFKEGLNRFSIRAIDGADNTGEINLSFFVDTIKPKILKINPNREFANGSIFVEFKEQNPESLSLIYGTNTSGFNEYGADIGSCTSNKDKYLCNVKLDLSSFDGKNISLSGILIDIANQNSTTKQFTLKVDSSAPVINSFSNNLNLNRLNVTISITENNFNTVKYIDNSAAFPRLTTICSILKGNVCTKVLTLSAGSHSLDFIVSDKAGNTALRHVDITV